MTTSILARRQTGAARRTRGYYPQVTELEDRVLPGETVLAALLFGPALELFSPASARKAPAPSCQARPERATPAPFLAAGSPCAQVLSPLTISKVAFSGPAYDASGPRPLEVVVASVPDKGDDILHESLPFPPEEGSPPRTAGGTWLPAAPLNEPGDWANGTRAIKTPVITAGIDGGFHAAYLVMSSPQPMLRYRHFDGVLAPARTVTNTARFLANPAITVGSEGQAHLVWENWNTGPEVGWAHTTKTGGITPTRVISTSAERAKWPQVAAIGFTGEPNGLVQSPILVSYWNSSSRQLRGIRHAFGWGPDQSAGANGANEYQVTGMARSPLDGSVYRLFGRQNGATYDIAYIRFTGSAWQAPVNVVTGLTYFPSRFSVAVSSGGWILAAWDSSNSTSGRLFVPGQGWSSVLSLYNKSFHGNVVAMPGTNDFYVFNPYARSFVTARPVLDGVQYPLEYLGTNLPDSFIPHVQGTAAADGTLYATWEYWANNGQQNPQAYYAVRTP